MNEIKSTRALNMVPMMETYVLVSVSVSASPLGLKKKVSLYQITNSFNIHSINTEYLPHERHELWQYNSKENKMQTCFVWLATIIPLHE